MIKRCKACGDHCAVDILREFSETLDLFVLDGDAEANQISDRKFVDDVLIKIKHRLDTLRSAKEAELTQAVAALKIEPKEATEQLLQVNIQKPGKHSQKKIYLVSIL